MIEAKPFDISKRDIWEAFKRVKANRGAAGVDGQSIADFEVDLPNNLYKLWNRLSSGSYFPSPVRRVESRWRDACVGYSNGRRSHCPGSCPSQPGAAFGAGISRRLLRLQAGQVGDRCRASGSSALLAIQLGARHRRQGLLRQHRLGCRPRTAVARSVGAAMSSLHLLPNGAPGALSQRRTLAQWPPPRRPGLHWLQLRQSLCGSSVAPPSRGSSLVLRGCLNDSSSPFLSGTIRRPR